MRVSCLRALGLVALIGMLFVCAMESEKVKAQVPVPNNPTFYGVLNNGLVIGMYKDNNYQGPNTRYTGSATADGWTYTIACIPVFPTATSKDNVAVYITDGTTTYSFWYNGNSVPTDWFGGQGYTLANVTPNSTDPTGVYCLIASNHANFPGWSNWANNQTGSSQ